MTHKGQMYTRFQETGKHTHTEVRLAFKGEGHPKKPGEDVGSGCLTSLLFLSMKAMAAGLTIWSFISWG